MTAQQIHSDAHLTGLRRWRGVIAASCPEHGVIGHTQPDTQQGRNAAITEARAHDDVQHGVFRSVGGWTIAYVTNGG